MPVLSAASLILLCSIGAVVALILYGYMICLEDQQVKEFKTLHKISMLMLAGALQIIIVVGFAPHL